MTLETSILPALVTFFGSMLPGVELRLGIPLGISMGLDPMSAFFIGIIGNIIPNFIILKLLGPFTDFLRRHSTKLDKLFTKLFEKTRDKHKKKFEQYGAFFIILFVAIPLPGSGSWSGSLIAFLFGVKYWKAMALIIIGVILAGLLVTTGFNGLFHIFHYLKG